MILLTSFFGKLNSSSVLLERLNTGGIKKITLTNSFQSSETQIVEAIKIIKPTHIISFGQKPDVHSLYIEQKARRDKDILESTIDIVELKKLLDAVALKYQISDCAGNYLCNNVYYTGMRYIQTMNLNTKMLLIHVPSLKSFVEFEKAVAFFNKYLEALSNE